MSIYFIYLLVILLGLAVGSFLNVVILRFDDLKSVVSTRSHCMKCKKQIPWYDLVPFFSYLILRGKCRFCKKDISIQYPIIEAVTAIIFACIYWHFGITWSSLFILVISSILIVIAAYDTLHLELPDILSYLGIIISIGFIFYKVAIAGEITVYQAYLPYIYGLLAGVGLMGILVILSRQKWMGAGDILVGSLMGLFLGFSNTLVALFFAFAIGAIFGLILIAMKKKGVKDVVPFAPFLVTGTFIALFFGTQILGFYLGSFSIFW